MKGGMKMSIIFFLVLIFFAALSMLCVLLSNLNFKRKADIPNKERLTVYNIEDYDYPLFPLKNNKGKKGINWTTSHSPLTLSH